MRDLPIIGWFILLTAGLIARPVLLWPGWLLLHLLFLGPITHAIVVFSSHFTNALTRSHPTPLARRHENLRLAAVNAGALAVLAGVPLRLTPLTLTGAALITVAIVLHTLSLWRRFRRALSGRFTPTVRYYLVSSVLFMIGVAIGTWEQVAGIRSLALAHALINLLGWIGITVAGTLVTLWPTLLRTRAATHSAHRSGVALPLLAAGVIVATVGAGFGVRALLTIGIVTYLLGLAIIGQLMIETLRTKRPTRAPELFVGIAFAWFIVIVTVFAIASAMQPLEALRAMLHDFAPLFAVGFAAQVLIGALSYLIPVLIGGGPQPVKLGTRVLGALGPLRVAVVNLALLLTLVPGEPALRVVAWSITLTTLATFVPLLISAWILQSRRRSRAT